MLPVFSVIIEYRMDGRNASALPGNSRCSPGGGGGGGHTSISLTGMLVRKQISSTQKNRMTLNSNPKKMEWLKMQCLSKFE